MYFNLAKSDIFVVHKIYMKRIFTVVLFIFIAFTANAQTQTLAYQWSKSIGDNARVTIDANGNLYVFGGLTGTADLDPGSSVANYTTPDVNFPDGYVVKLNSTGVFQWAKVISGNGGEGINDIAFDAAGNLLLAVSMGGYYLGQPLPNTDLDPGSGTYNLPWNSVYGQGALVKLDAAGNFLWAKTLVPEVSSDINFPSYSGIGKVKVNSDNEIYLAGNFRGTMDLDPGAGVSSHTSPTASGSEFLLKLDALGNFIWVDYWEREAGFLNDVSINDIAIDGIGNAYILASGRNIDADPSLTAQYLPFLLNNTCFVIKINSNGEFQWANQLNPANGQISGSSITLDISDNIYITGNFTELLDLNNVNRFAIGGSDIFIAKLSNNGNFNTLKYVGGIYDDGGTDIFVDPSGFIFSTGYFGNNNTGLGGGIIDLNPGSGVNNLTSIGGRDNYLWILSPSATFVWAGNVGSNGAIDNGYCLVPGVDNSVYFAGSYDNSASPATAIDFDPNPGIVPVTTKGGFVVKYNKNTCTTFAGGTASVLNNVSCYNGANGSAIMTQLTGGTLPYYYEWNTNPVQNTQTLTNVPAGLYSVTATDAAGCTRTASTTITQPQSAVSNVTASMLSKTCSNSSNGSVTVTTAQGGTPPYSYSWNTNPVQSGQVAIGLPVGTYTVTVADAYGCSLSSSTSVSSYPIPTAPSICMASVDNSGQHNILYWDKTPYVSADSFIVYRETNLNNFQRIAAISYDSLSMFIDTVANLYPSFTGNPNLGTNRYKLQVVDTCGNYSTLGTWHKTIFVNQTGGVFTFNDYSIQGQPVPLNELSTYQLWRDDSTSGNWNLLSSNASSPMNDPDYAIYPNASWCIKTVWSISCSPSKIYNFSQSNILGKATVGLNEQVIKQSDIAVYPNPASTSINITIAPVNKVNSIDIISATGAFVSTFTVDGIQQLEIPVSAIAEGLYTLRFNTKAGYICKKIMVK